MTLSLPSSLGFLLVLVVASWLSHPLIILWFVLVTGLLGWLGTRLFRAIPLASEERLVLGVGLGLAGIPVVTALYKLLHIPLTPVTLLALLAALAVLAWRLELSHPRVPKSLMVAYQPNVHQLLLLFLLMLSVVTRLAPIRHLEAAPFADPALQGMIARLILINRGIPDTWEPFVPIAFHHQPGFASIAAWLALLSHQSIPHIILFLTNLVHALFPFSIYVLARTLFPNRLQGLVAVLLAVLAAYPTLTFVAGMNAAATMYLLVPLSAALVIRLLDVDIGRGLGTPWRLLAGFTGLWAGAMLIHPTFFVFFLITAGPLLVARLATRNGVRNLDTTSLGIMTLALVMAVAFVAPFLSLASTNQGLLEEQWDIQARYINPERRLLASWLIEPLFVLFANPQGTWFLYLEEMPLQTLVVFHGVGLLMTAWFLYAVFLACRGRDRLGVSLVALYLIFVSLSSLQSVMKAEFPGWSALYPTRVKFLIILPIALLLTLPFTALREEDVRPRRLQGSLPLLCLLLIVPHGLWEIASGLRRLASLSPISPSEMRAIRWIEDHVPEGATILNMVKDVEAGVFIGGAGQWIPTMTGHPVVFPPLSLTEDVLNPIIADRLQLMKALTTREAPGQAVAALLSRYRIAYVFLSPRMMQTRRMLFPPVSPEQFLASPQYRLEFQDGNAYVFSVVNAH